jgi:hypothetical protein
MWRAFALLVAVLIAPAPCRAGTSLFDRPTAPGSRLPPAHTTTPSVEIVGPLDGALITAPELGVSFGIHNQPAAARGLCVRINDGKCQPTKFFANHIDVCLVNTGIAGGGTIKTHLSLGLLDERGRVIVESDDVRVAFQVPRHSFVVSTFLPVDAVVVGREVYLHITADRRFLGIAAANEAVGGEASIPGRFKRACRFRQSLLAFPFAIKYSRCIPSFVPYLALSYLTRRRG